MSDIPLFDLVAQEIENRCQLTTIQVRGTLRIAIKDAGLDPKLITTRQMTVILNKVLGQHLIRRGIEAEQSKQICATIVSTITEADLPDPTGIERLPESLFERLNQR